MSQGVALALSPHKLWRATWRRSVSAAPLRPPEPGVLLWSEPKRAAAVTPAVLVAILQWKLSPILNALWLFCASFLRISRRDLSLLSFSAVFSPHFSTFPLNTVVFLSSSCGSSSAPSRAQGLGTEIPPLAGRLSSSSSASASPLGVARQLWIIKWWIRGYFLPTQTGGGRAAVRGCRFYPAFFSKCYQIPPLPFLPECRKQSWKLCTSLCVSSLARINEPRMLQGKIPAVIRNSSPLLLIVFFFFSSSFFRCRF